MGVRIVVQEQGCGDEEFVAIMHLTDCALHVIAHSTPYPVYG